MMGERVNPSLSPFISKAVGKWGGGHLPKREKIVVRDVSVPGKAAGSRLR